MNETTPPLLQRVVRGFARPLRRVARGGSPAPGTSDFRYEYKRLMLDPDVLRGSLVLRTATARHRARLPEAIARERRFLESSTSYAKAVQEGASAGAFERRIELDGLAWRVPLPPSGDPAYTARVVSHQDFPYRVIAQTRELAIGGIMLDVGGNNGRMSIPRVILGDVQAAYCAEPEPRNYACLVQNVLDNGLAGLVMPDWVAIGARDGTVRLMRAKSPGGHKVIAADARARGETVDVPCLTLDSWCSRLGLDLAQVSFVKVDVQGSEIDVLTGASRVLACRHIAWQIEVDVQMFRERGITAEEFFALLRPHFTHWIDLEKRATGPRVRTIEQLADGLAHLGGKAGPRTDVLLFTMQPAAASAVSA
jgi:FkbM family methyltransferase